MAIVATGPLSDRYGRKGLFVAGVQALGLFLTAASHGFGWWSVIYVLLARRFQARGHSLLQQPPNDISRVDAGALPDREGPNLFQRSDF